MPETAVNEHGEAGLWENKVRFARQFGTMRHRGENFADSGTSIGVSASMAVGEDWSPLEVRATVLDYMAMLKFELSGQPYSKTVHRRALLTRLAGRSEGAVEMKHQNISAVLRDIGHFWIPGYKPRSNYQGILAAEVETWIYANPELDRHALAAAEAPAATPEHFDFSVFEVSSPSLGPGREAGVQEAQAPFGEETRIAVKHDYAAREARSSSLGQAGEELVLKFEQYRLGTFKDQFEEKFDIRNSWKT